MIQESVNRIKCMVIIDSSASLTFAESFSDHYLEVSHHRAKHRSSLHNAEVGGRRRRRGNHRWSGDRRRESASVVRRDARDVRNRVAQLHVVAHVAYRLERELGEVAGRLVHFAAAATSHEGTLLSGDT